MTRDQVKSLLDRVMALSDKDQDRIARVVDRLEALRGHDELTDDDWRIVEERAARRDLASDHEVEAVFARYLV